MTTNETPLALADLPKELIDNLIDDIYESVGLRVTLTWEDGKKMRRPEDRSELCPGCSDMSYLSHCAACRDEVVRRIRQMDEALVYRCWRGLMCAAAPIKVDGQYLGSLEISAFVSTPESMAEAEQILPIPEHQLSAEELKKLPFLYRPRVLDCIRIIRIATRCLTELYRRQNAEQLQSQAEYKALQSQIRPHFLFNTLNSISQLAFLEGAEQAPEAIYALAGILRRSMKQAVQHVPLSEELELIEDYIRIKQLTSRVPIRLYREIEEGLEKLRIPLFCLQPLVENAISHGLEKREEGGTVSVTAYCSESHVVLSVTDDGAGFDPESFKPPEDGEMSGIGFNNVIQRMQSFFGSGFYPAVVSAPGEGTTISLNIPREKAVL